MNVYGWHEHGHPRPYCLRCMGNGKAFPGPFVDVGIAYGKYHPQLPLPTFTAWGCAHTEEARLAILFSRLATHTHPDCIQSIHLLHSGVENEWAQFPGRWWCLLIRLHSPDNPNCFCMWVCGFFIPASPQLDQSLSFATTLSSACGWVDVCAYNTNYRSWLSPTIWLWVLNSDH